MECHLHYVTAWYSHLDVCLISLLLLNARYRLCHVNEWLVPFFISDFVCVLMMMMISVVCVCVFCVIFFIHRFCAVLLSMMRIDGLSGHLSHCNRNIIKQMKLHKADKMLCPLLHFTQFSLWSNRKDETNVRVCARDRSSLYMHILCCFARKMCWHFWRTKNPDSTIKLTRFSTK